VTGQRARPIDDSPAKSRRSGLPAPLVWTLTRSGLGMLPKRTTLVTPPINIGVTPRGDAFRVWRRYGSVVRPGTRDRMRLSFGFHAVIMTLEKAGWPHGLMSDDHGASNCISAAQPNGARSSAAGTMARVAMDERLPSGFTYTQ
jgi:hypothetical protein